MTCVFEDGAHKGLKVSPRWPSRKVRISQAAWDKLLIVQSQLPHDIRLIVTRGYEPSTSRIGTSRKLFRTLGIGVFCLLHRTRLNEVNEIFGANGHDVDGNHIDVSIELNHERLRFLPLGVFTPIFWQNRRRRKYFPYLDQVMAALIDNGFHIHNNATESLQIHCDLVQ